MHSLITLGAIETARARIAPHVVHTPLVSLGPGDIVLKAENLQPSGAFKLRGAFNALLSLDEKARARGVVAHSSGNHAIAVAFAARRLGVSATIVMPENAPRVKLEWVKSLGARLEIVGVASSERLARAAALAEAEGLALVEPYDAAAIIEGTGTLGLELLDDWATGDPLEIYVPVSGGGLIAGVAAAVKQRRPSVRVIGVEPELAADAGESFRAGERVTWPADQVSQTIADGLRVQRVGALPWAHMQAYVDDMVAVSEAEILGTVRDIASHARLVAEPSGAVAVAAARVGRGGADVSATRRVAIVSGGNVDPGLLARVFGAALDATVGRR
jgi:threonine dehydratase